MIAKAAVDRRFRNHDRAAHDDAVPVKDGARDWFAPLIPGGWMAWTFPDRAVLPDDLRSCR